MNRSVETRMKLIIKQIEKKCKSLFNKDFFSIYEGIIESVDKENAEVTVRIPELDDLSFNNCRIVTPCLNSDVYFMPEYTIGGHVIIGFRAFSLKNPVVLGQLNPSDTVYKSLRNNGISLTKGDAEIIITDDKITLSNGSSAIEITDDAITLNGSSVTAGSNDLLYDDPGSM